MLSAIKRFATTVLVATLLATLYGGGGLIRNVQFTYELGLYWIVVNLFDCFGLWIIAKLALRMGPFMQHLSMVETIGHIYGKYPRFVAALVGICGSIFGITIQIAIMSQAISMCVGTIDAGIITVFATLILILYSTFGGIRAITLTDIFQLLTFTITIPLLIRAVFIKVNKPIAEIVLLWQSTPKFQLGNLCHCNIQLVGMLLLLLSSLMFYIEPSIVQRVYMASGPIQAQKVFLRATLFNLFIIGSIILIGLCVFANRPNLPVTEVWNYIMAGISPLFKGFVAISLLAMAMSTADSLLNACAIMVSHDIVKSIQNEKEISDMCQLKIARWATLVVGLLAMILADYCKDLLKLMYWSIDCVVPIVSAPFILAILGFRGTASTALSGMATGALSMVVWNQWVEPLIHVEGAFICMVANGLMMIAVHYLLPQPKAIGWVGQDAQQKRMRQLILAFKKYKKMLDLE